jgi:hypothetical protein
MAFWSIFAKAGKTDVADKEEDLQTIQKGDFINFLVKVFKTLRKKDFDESTAISCAERDWEHDSSHSSYMLEDDFFHSLFELCDYWTMTVDEDDYIKFLAQLRERMTVRVLVYADGSIARILPTLDILQEQVNHIPAVVADDFRLDHALLHLSSAQYILFLRFYDTAFCFVYRRYIANLIAESNCKGKDLMRTMGELATMNPALFQAFAGLDSTLTPWMKKRILFYCSILHTMIHISYRTSPHFCSRSGRKTGD